MNLGVSRTRATALTVVALLGAGWAAASAWSGVSGLLGSRPGDFATLIAVAAHLGLAGAAGWLLLACLSLVAEAWSHAPRRRGPLAVAVPTWLRRLALVSAGASLAAATVTTAHAGVVPRVGSVDGADGLPLPERPATGVRIPAPRAPAAAAPAATETSAGVHVVRPGDTLWQIAGGDPRRVARLHASNREVIGPDPDTILPGQRLTLPWTVPAQDGVIR